MFNVLGKIVGTGEAEGNLQSIQQAAKVAQDVSEAAGAIQDSVDKTRSITPADPEMTFLAPLRNEIIKGQDWLNHVEIGGSPTELAVLSLSGVLLIFWGKTLFRLWLLLFGLWTGWDIGTQLNARFLGLTDTSRLVFLGAVAIAMAILFTVAYRFSFFLAGAAGGVYLFKFFLEIADQGPVQDANYLYYLIALIAGFVAATFRDQFVAVITSLTGGFLLTDALLALFKITPAGAVIHTNFAVFTSTSKDLLMLFFIISFTLLGCWFQLRKRGRRWP